MAVNSRTGEEHVVTSLTGRRLGNCSLNREGLVGVPVRRDGFCEVAVADPRRGTADILFGAEEVGHIQFCPVDDALILFSGSVRERIWCHDTASGRTWRPYVEDRDEWIVHETWLGGSRRILFARWPYSLMVVDAGGASVADNRDSAGRSAPATVASLNAWHICSDPRGQRIVCDTNNPDRGLLLIEAESGSVKPLCFARASQRGTQWRFDRPADSEGMDVSIIRSLNPEEDRPPTPEDPPSLYGPQWSHPHPSFSPDGARVVFTSDRDRYSHVYSVPTPPESTATRSGPRTSG